MTRPAVLAAALLAAAPLALHAQSAQRWSVQVSGISVMPSGDAFEGLKSGIGGEAQLRFTPGVLSIGVGFQYSSHKADFSEDLGEDFSDQTVKISGPFIEPRYVIDVHKESLAPYIAARVAFLTQKSDFDTGIGTATLSASGTQINLGGGVLFRLSPRMNLDLGATYGRIHFDEAKLTFNGQTETADADASGNNLVLRAGLAIGIGK